MGARRGWAPRRGHWGRRTGEARVHAGAAMMQGRARARAVVGRGATPGGRAAWGRAAWGRAARRGHRAGQGARRG
jgi:hypothetical protein